MLVESFQATIDSLSIKATRDALKIEELDLLLQDLKIQMEQEKARAMNQNNLIYERMFNKIQ